MFDELKKYIEEQKASNRLQAPARPSDDDESLRERLRRLGPSPSLADHLGSKASTGMARENEDAARGDKITQIVLDVAKERSDSAQASAAEAKAEQQGHALIKIILIGAGCTGLGAVIGLAFLKYFG
jgi:hypothetical protein